MQRSDLFLLLAAQKDGKSLLQDEEVLVLPDSMHPWLTAHVNQDPVLRSWDQRERLVTPQELLPRLARFCKAYKIEMLYDTVAKLCTRPPPQRSFTPDQLLWRAVQERIVDHVREDLELCRWARGASLPPLLLAKRLDEWIVLGIEHKDVEQMRSLYLEFREHLTPPDSSIWPIETWTGPNRGWAIDFALHHGCEHWFLYWHQTEVESEGAEAITEPRQCDLAALSARKSINSSSATAPSLQPHQASFQDSQAASAPKVCARLDLKKPSSTTTRVPAHNNSHIRGSPQGKVRPTATLQNASSSLRTSASASSSALVPRPPPARRQTKPLPGRAQSFK